MVGAYIKPVSNPQVNPTVQYVVQRYSQEGIKQEIRRLYEMSAELEASGIQNNDSKKLIPYYEVALKLKEKSQHDNR